MFNLLKDNTLHPFYCPQNELFGLIDEQLQEAVKPDVYLENGYLAFKNMEAVDSVIQMLGMMKRTEKEAWEQQIGLNSARAEFDKLFDEYENLESYIDFVAFKEKNKGKLSFNETDPDDCSIDYPFATKHFLPILNSEGVFQVGMNIFKYTNDMEQFIITDGDINKLKNISAKLNDNKVISMPRLKSITILHAFPEDDPSHNNNVYHRKPNISDRKLKNELFIDQYITKMSTGFWKRGYYVNINQRGQKISWGKWKDYSTTYGMRKVRCEIGSNYIHYINTHISLEVSSSVNFALANDVDFISWPDPYSPPFYPIPDIDFAAEVSFRGFGFLDDQFYKIDNPTGYALASSNNYPSTGWGY